MEVLVEISTPVAAWNFLITDLKASSGGIRKSTSYLANSLPISPSSASGHSCFTTAIWFAYVVWSLMSITRVRDWVTRLFQPTIHLARNAPDKTLLGKRLSVRVGEDSAPHYLRDASSNRRSLNVPMGFMRYRRRFLWMPLRIGNGRFRTMSFRSADCI